MGFEERALAFLSRARAQNLHIGTTYAIRYLPHNERNRENAFLEMAKAVSKNVVILTYNRYSPEEFSREIPNICDTIPEESILVDISGLSKLGIIVLLSGLSRSRKALKVFYAEARTYHPTREKYESMNKTQTVPYFSGYLTTNVYDILGTSSLSSVDMPASPLALAAFPTFNRLELSALLNEINPQKLLLLEGTPPDPDNAWRLKAIDEINSAVKLYAEQTKTVSTLLYSETLDALDEFYREIQYSHRLVIAPTGSKMQSVAVLISKLIHPDIQIIYPVVESFDIDYSLGWSKMWEVDFGLFSEFVKRMDSLRRNSVNDLRAKLDQPNA
jgi:hypothetical protein